ncbi:MAG: S8 family serine peptidase, partial [Bacteroidota bacterium]
MTTVLSYIYPVLFGIALFSLIFWFFFKGNRDWSKKMRNTFFLSFLGYLGVMLLAPSSLLTGKLLLLARDLTLMGVLSTLFSRFKTNKFLFFGMLAGLVGALSFGGFQYLQQSYLQQTLWPSVTELANLDPQNELLVEIAEGEDVLQLEDIFKKYELEYEQAFTDMDHPEWTDLDDFYALNIPKRKVFKIKEIMDALNQSPIVDLVEENERILLGPVMESKDVEATKKEFQLNDPEIGNLWGFDKMNIDQLINLIKTDEIKPKRKAVIAILDTGVDSKHEDIKDNYTSFARKFDDDPHSHGTHCAGIAAAVSNNGKGIASFSTENQFVQVSSVKVLNSYGMGSQRSIINGILKAADNKADVISMSLGGPSNDKKQKAYEKAIRYANQRGAIVVAAAGNENINAITRSPANVDGVIAVSAIDQNLNKATFSNEVQDLRMGIAAPGVNIYSTIPDNKYAFYNGTS